MSKEYLWYACYGSNLSERRFNIYIEGGSITINGHTVTEKGSRDKTPPLDSVVGEIPYRLIFAGNFAKWEDRSAAFLDLSRKEEKLKTTCRMYKITLEQFMDVVAQENGGVKPEEFSLADLTEKGFLDLYPKLPYGRLVHVDNKEGLSVLSFTFPDTWPGADAERTTPCKPYLEVIRSGLCECGLSSKEAAEYLKQRVDANR